MVGGEIWRLYIRMSRGAGLVVSLEVHKFNISKAEQISPRTICKAIYVTILIQAVGSWLLCNGGMY